MLKDIYTDFIVLKYNFNIFNNNFNNKCMKIKGKFLSYISAEKKLRKEQSKAVKKSAPRNDATLGETISNSTGNNAVTYQYN